MRAASSQHLPAHRQSIKATYRGAPLGGNPIAACVMLSNEIAAFAGIDLALILQNFRRGRSIVRIL
jgi:hypothetical protein